MFISLSLDVFILPLLSRSVDVNKERGFLVGSVVREPAARFLLGKFLPGWVMARGERERTPRRIIYMAKRR